MIVVVKERGLVNGREMEAQGQNSFISALAWIDLARHKPRDWGGLSGGSRC